MSNGNILNPIVIKAYSDNYRLSPHFSYGEMTISDIAERKGILNRPDEIQITNMKNLCVNILEPIRTYFGKSVIISSGFRTPELNKAIGGSETSQHRFGEAADFIIIDKELVAIYEWVILNSNLDYDQIIHEFGRWIHISHTKRYKNRQKNTVAMRVDGKTQYTHYLKQQIQSGNYTHA
jgi:hypothetical protein